MIAEIFSDLSRATDSNSTPISGATWTFYETGTLTKQAIYETSELTVELNNPVVSDSGGLFAPIYLDASLQYRGVLKDASGTTLRDIDPINSGLAIVLAATGPGQGAAKVGFKQVGTGAVERTVDHKLQERESAADYGTAADNAVDDSTALEAALDAAHIGTHNLSLGSGKYRLTTPIEIPNNRSFEQRGTPLSIVGAGAGSPYISSGGNGAAGTIIVADSVATTTPVFFIKERGVADGGLLHDGAPPIELGKFRVEGTTNAGVPIFQTDMIPAFGHLHDIAVRQNGAGDGMRLGPNIVGHTERIFVLNNDVVATKTKALRTGVGVNVLPTRDYGLAAIHGSSRGFQTGYVFGYNINDHPDNPRNLGAKFRGECSTVGDGIVVKQLNECTLLEQPFFEGITDKGITDRGRFTMLLNPYFSFGTADPPDFGVTNIHVEWGADCRGPTILGGCFPLVASGIGLNSIASVYGGAVFGATFIDGGAGSVGVRVLGRSDPKMNVIANFSDGVWAGTPVQDDSYSTAHGGSGQANGSGLIGFMPRRTLSTTDGTKAFVFQELSRGGYRGMFDPTPITHGYWSGDTMLLGEAPNFVVETYAARSVNRFKAPNLPDKAGVLYFNSSSTQPCTFKPSAYVKGITADETIAAGEDAIVVYQVVPGPLAAVHLRIFRQLPKDPVHTVATLTALSNVAAGSRAFVSDSTTTVDAGHGTTVAGNGQNFVPVYYDGTSWIIG